MAYVGSKMLPALALPLHFWRILRKCCETLSTYQQP